MKPLVMKFGGTSMGSAEAIRRTAEIVGAARADWPQICVVVSAMSGVTDLLLQTAQAAAHGDNRALPAALSRLADRHLSTLSELKSSGPGRAEIEARLAEFEALTQAIGVLGEASPRALDAVGSLGERMSIHLAAAGLASLGLRAPAMDATGVIVTDAMFQSASPDMTATRSRAREILAPLLADGAVPVVTGFVGATPAGQVTTLGRGGSDFSAAILGVALDAAEVWIWTDVDGVMTADPRVVPEARTLPTVTYSEISELAYYGARVLHPRTIRPVVEGGIALWVKNTFKPAGAGTRIVPDASSPASPAPLRSGDHGLLREENPQERGAAGAIKAVTAIKSQKLIAIEGRGMLGVPGIAARAFSAVARTKTSVVMISQSSSEQSICFVVPADHAAPVVAELLEEFRVELQRGDIDSVRDSEEIVIVTVVGAGMRHTPGIAARVFGALGEAAVNVIAIAQGSSECSISLAVAAPEADRAVRAIHGRLDGNL